MALMVLRTCGQVEGGLPASVRSKMVFNIILDFVVGLVPFIGDLADAVFRANTRNAIELETYLREKGAKNLKAQGRVSTYDPTDPDEYDRMEDGQYSPPQYSSHPPSRQPTQTRQHGNGQSSRREEERGGWFSRSRAEDVERGDRPRQPADAYLRDEPRRNKSTKSTLQKNRR